MPVYTRNDVRRALQLELAIRATLDEMLSQDSGQPDSGDPRAVAYEASTARIAALQTLLKRAPDDEAIDAVY